MRASTIAAAVLGLVTLGVLFLPGGPASGRSLRMVVWGMPFEDRLFRDRYAREFEAANPGTTVEYIRASDVRTKYNAWAARGIGAGVMRIEATWYHDFAARGLIEPLSARLRDPSRGLTAAQQAAFPPHLMRMLDIDGEIYALPQDNAQYGLYYNKTIFDEWNTGNPDDPIEYPNAGWTWADLRRAAAKLTRRSPGGVIEVAGFDAPVWAWTFMAYFAQAGGRLWSDDGHDCLIDSEAGVEALAFLRAMQREDRSYSPTISGYLAGAGADAKFAGGRTAMYMDGCWRVPNFDATAPNLRYAVAPLPRGRVAAVPSGACLWAISAYAPDKDAAWEFIRYLVSDEAAAAYWDALRVAPPANLSFIASEEFRSANGIRATDGSRGFDVPPLEVRDFGDKVAWLRAAYEIDPATGREPAFIHAHRFAADLQDSITRMLVEYLKEGSALSERAALADAARHMRHVMDRARSGARGD